MSAFNEKFEGLSPSRQAERYSRLADAARRYYDLGTVTPVFVQHNGGVTYRLDGPEGNPFYLLKIAQPVGESGGIPPERIERVMQWLAAIAATDTIVVQEPIANRHGELVTAVDFADLDEPFFVTVQRWIDGEHVREAYTPVEAYRVGVMIGRLHEQSSRWTPRQIEDAIEFDDLWLANCLAALRRVVDAGILTRAEWRTVEFGAQRLAEIMMALRRDRKLWGAIHSDLHQGNLLFHGETVRPIDFDDFVLGHFPHDIGVVLYHLMYLEDVDVRRAVRDGYRSVRTLPDEYPLWGEAFLCAAAFGNLAFQVTIPSELASDHFARNVREFANSFCSDLTSGTPFVFDEGPG